MNSQEIKDISLMYEAVYNDELREKANEYNNTEFVDLDEAARRTPRKVRGGKDPEKEMSGRSDAGKRISGDEETGPRYYTLGRSRGVSPDAPTQSGQRPERTPKLSDSEKEDLNETTRLFYKLQAKGKRGSSTAQAQLRSDADLATQKSAKIKRQQARQRQERESDDDPRDHGSLSAAERNPSMR